MPKLSPLLGFAAAFSFLAEMACAAPDAPTSQEVSNVMSAIAADPSKLDAFCWLMTELGKGGVPESGERAAVFLERMAELGPVFERSFDLDPASPAGINFEESVAGLYERCDK